MLRVFVSHKSQDTEVAKSITAALKGLGVDAYLDAFDSALSADGIDLAEYFKGQIRKSTHLLAVISQQTKESWWVPFEIGVAAGEDHPLGTYLYKDATIPSYLAKWPCIRDVSQLDVFLNVAREAEKQLLYEDISKASATEKRSYAATFHKNLKSKLGQ